MSRSSVGDISRTHFRPTREVPGIPLPKSRPTRDIPFPNELVRYVKSFNYDDADHLSLDHLEIQYFESPLYETKIAAYEHSNYIADGPFGVVILSLLHPKSMELIRRSKKKMGMKMGSGSMRDTRKTFNFGGLSQPIEEPEPIEEGVATTSHRKSSKKDSSGKKKGGGIGGFMKKSSQAIADKINKKEHKKDNKNEFEKSSPSPKKSSKGRNTLSRKKKVAFENFSESHEFSGEDDSKSVTVSDVLNEDDSVLDSMDIGSIPVAPMEGLLRTESGDIWIKIKTEEPITKEKQLLKLFLAKMPKYSKLQFNLMKSLNTPDSLLVLENILFMKAFTFSVLNRKEGQHTYEQIISNNEVTPGMKEFLEAIGARLIRLTGWKGFDGGLSTKMFAEDGEESYFTEFADHEIMFHVGPMLPSESVGDDEDNAIPRTKIENNTVLILFDEAKYPVNPSILKYEMVQTILVARKVSDDPPQYKMTVVSKENVQDHKPIFELETILEPSDTFKSVILTKLLNCHRASASTIPAVAKTMKKRRTKFEQLHQQFLEEQ